MEQILKIAGFIIDSFIHIWPYLLITIPLAVAVQTSGAAKYINKAMSYNPIASILLATLVGAFSPFCSCGVIPVITSLLIGGVPLAPVMSFWIASPSMDPEIFFLSTATIGWELSVWRLVATFVISLSAGFITHFAFQKGFLGKDILRNNMSSKQKQTEPISLRIKTGLSKIFTFKKPVKKVSVQLIRISNAVNQPKVNCCVAVDELTYNPDLMVKQDEKSCSSCEPKQVEPISFHKKLLAETWKATILVIKFMSLAFFINALIKFYVPQDFITSLLGGTGSSSVVIATLVGIPAYTSNLTALPVISGLLTLGMKKGAALAFLIAGPVTTLPAMVAVWGIVKRKIFILYLFFSLIGALLFGLLYNLIG